MFPVPPPPPTSHSSSGHYGPSQPEPSFSGLDHDVFAAQLASHSQYEYPSFESSLSAANDSTNGFNELAYSQNATSGAHRAFRTDSGAYGFGSLNSNPSASSSISSSSGLSQSNYNHNYIGNNSSSNSNPNIYIGTGYVRDNINLQLKLGGTARQNSPMNQYHAASPAFALHSSQNSNKRPVISPVVVTTPFANRTGEYTVNNIALQTFVEQPLDIATPPRSPGMPLMLESIYEGMQTMDAPAAYGIFDAESEAYHDGFFNYDIPHSTTAEEDAVSPRTTVDLDQMSLESELSIVEQQQKQLQLHLQLSKQLQADQQRQGQLNEQTSFQVRETHFQDDNQPKVIPTKRPRKKSPVVKTDKFDLDTSLDVKTAIELAAKAFTRSYPPPVHRSGFPQASVPIMPLSPSSSASSSLSTPQAQGYGFSRNLKMKDRLLERFSEATIKKIRVSEKELDCLNHCKMVFKDYVALADHYDEHMLYRHHPRPFVCPVVECPMNIIGYNKRAFLKQHVVAHHFAKGYVRPESEKYSDQLLKIIYVCEHEDCKKGFYRRDSLTRHLKLVHGNNQSQFNLKKRKGDEESVSPQRRRRTR